MQVNLKLEDVVRYLLQKDSCVKSVLQSYSASHFLKIIYGSKCRSDKLLLWNNLCSYIFSSLLDSECCSSCFLFFLSNEYIGMVYIVFVFRQIVEVLLLKIHCNPVGFFFDMSISVIYIKWIKISLFYVFQVQAIFSISSIATWWIWRSRPLYTGFSVDRRSTKSHVNWMYKVCFVIFCSFLTKQVPVFKFV